MKATTCCDDACGCEGGTFTRLRYTYGQRLTAVDLLDEQAYLIGKDRFVARHVLGAGILCGLRVSRRGDEPDLTPMLRVTRGAALDACGREILVGTDHCLDVAAWYARHRDDLGWDEPGVYPAWAGLRYRECPSDPALVVPGDPCGCDSGGCSYTRVHEGFELALHAEVGAVHPAGPPGGTTHLCHELGAGVPAAHVLGPESCPSCDCDPWLLVAAVAVHVEEAAAGAGLRVTDVDDPDHHDPRRLNLHSLGALQQVVTELAGGGAACAPGPRLGELGGDGDVDAGSALTEGRLSLAVDLAEDDDGVVVPLAEGTVDPARFTLSGVGAAGWEEVAVDVAYDPAVPAFLLKSGAVELDRPYRFVFSPDPAHSVVDTELRPLRPAPWSASVRWLLQDDAVTVQTAP